jgi:hypothetical protein
MLSKNTIFIYCNTIFYIIDSFFTHLKRYVLTALLLQLFQWRTVAKCNNFLYIFFSVKYSSWMSLTINKNHDIFVKYMLRNSRYYIYGRESTNMCCILYTFSKVWTEIVLSFYSSVIVYNCIPYTFDVITDIYNVCIVYAPK